MVTEPADERPPLTVLYDGACPLCRREIGVYRGLLWAALPGWRGLALVGRLPGAAWAMERAYRFFLRWRPMLQRWASRLEPAA